MMEDGIDGLDDFSSFDMKSLLSDPSLQAELHALGWKEETNLIEAHPIQGVPAGQHIDLDTLVGVEDLHVTFEESDMNDPDLLKAYEELASPGSKVVTETSGPVSTVNLLNSTVNAASKMPSQIPLNELDGVSSAEAKRRACQFKREGNTDEALKWFRYAKQLENTVSPVSPGTLLPVAKNTNVVVPTKLVAEKIEPRLPTKVSPFVALEEAITQASEAALNSAKLLREKDPKVAVEEMREHKRLQQELTVLKARASIPNMQPPLFHWESVQRQEKIEFLELGENDLKLDIKSLASLENILKEHSSRTISINYNFGQSSLKDSSQPELGGSTRQFTYELNKQLGVHHEVVLNCLKRGKLAQQTYGRKKINFEIVLHRGFFRSNLVIAMATAPLQPLLDVCESAQELPLYLAEIVDGNVKKGKAVGGCLKMTLRVRTPIAKPEIRVTETRRLVIGPWPMATAVVADPTPSPVKQKEVPPENNKSKLILPYDDVLTEKEKNDPEDLEFIVSNDVLESEIEKFQQLMNTTVDEDDRFSLTTKIQLLSVKLQILVSQVQNESLTIEEYLNIIKDRIKRDQMMALYQKAKGNPDSLILAVNLMRRIKIMQAELKNAEESMEEGDA